MIKLNIDIPISVKIIIDPNKIKNVMNEFATFLVLNNENPKIKR